jgi:hypothetical protein
MAEPRFFLLAGRKSAEIPGGWLRDRRRIDAESEAGADAMAIEIAPGVRASVIGWGDHLVPDKSERGFGVVAGAMVAVFTEGED